MAASLSYNVPQAPSTSTYYTVWNTYNQTKKRAVPSHFFLQARVQPGAGTYPMDWDYDGAKKLVMGMKAKRSSQRQAITKQRAESAVRRQYRKQMFDYALKDASKDFSSCKERQGYHVIAAHDTDAVYPKETMQRQRPKTTGPTRHGSPIYNRRADLLSSIRAQTATRLSSNERFTGDYMPTADHRSTISQNIDRYNREYRLISENSAEDLRMENAKFVDKDVNNAHKTKTRLSPDNPCEPTKDAVVEQVTIVSLATTGDKLSEPRAQTKPSSHLPILKVEMPDDKVVEETSALHAMQTSALLQVKVHARPLSAMSAR